MVLDFDVRLFPIFVSALVTFILGWLWFSPAMFGNMWMKMMGITKAQMKKAKKKSMAGIIVMAFILQLIFCWVLSVIIATTGATTWMQGLGVGFFIWLGFNMTVLAGMVLWEGKALRMYWILTIHWLVTLLLAGAILGPWH